MSRPSDRWFRQRRTSSSVEGRTWFFDSDSKGTGARIGLHDPKKAAQEHQSIVSIKPAKRSRQLPTREQQKSLERLLQEQLVPHADAVRVAYRIANFHENRTRSIPQDLRVAVARLVLRVSGDKHAAQQVLYGLHDDHLVELLPED